jgi:uncharacterized protein with HEPN domain
VKAEHHRLTDWLDDLVENAEKVVLYTDPLSYEQFAANEPARDLVTKKIENMGEAARYLRELHPGYFQSVSDVPWRKLTETRNRLSHGYFDVSPAILWDTARQAIPPLIAIFRRMRQTAPLAE